MAIQLEKLQNERDRVAGECLEASQPVAISDMKINNKSYYWQPPGVTITGYELSEFGKSNELCQNFVKPAKLFSKELFIRQLSFSRSKRHVKRRVKIKKKHMLNTFNSLFNKVFNFITSSVF